MSQMSFSILRNCRFELSQPLQRCYHSLLRRSLLCSLLSTVRKMWNIDSTSEALHHDDGKSFSLSFPFQFPNRYVDGTQKRFTLAHPQENLCNVNNFLGKASSKVLKRLPTDIRENSIIAEKFLSIFASSTKRLICAHRVSQFHGW